MPPLRVRGDDILLIAREFLECYALEDGKAFEGFSDEVEILLLAYKWPGNVRELQNTLRKIVVLHDGATVTTEMLSPTLREAAPQQTLPFDGDDQKSDPPSQANAMQRSPLDETIIPLWQVEMAAIERAIEICDGNVNRAAELLDINPSTIYRKRNRWKPDGQD